MKIFKQGFLEGMFLVFYIFLSFNADLFGQCGDRAHHRGPCNEDPSWIWKGAWDIHFGPSYFSPVDNKEFDGVKLNSMSGYSLAIDYSINLSRSATRQRFRLEYNDVKKKTSDREYTELNIGFHFFTKLGKNGNETSNIIGGIGGGMGFTDLKSITRKDSFSSDGRASYLSGMVYYLEADIIKYLYYSSVGVSISAHVKWNISGDIRGFIIYPALSISFNNFTGFDIGNIKESNNLTRQRKERYSPDSLQKQLMDNDLQKELMDK